MNRPRSARGRALAISPAILLLAAVPIAGQEVNPATDPAADVLPVYRLDPLLVEGRSDDLTNLAATASQGLVGYEDFSLRPLVREAEVMETVPGLIMTQHSGDGKSNQMFVRGFNLDHGTDFSTKVEAMPVNIPSHAHGQGYTDLNFIIPELVDRVEYRLGTYYAEIGDFGAAGGADLRLRRELSRPVFSASAGAGGYGRVVGAASVDAGTGALLIGGEYKRYDGPWDLPQNLGKKAALARYSWGGGTSRFSLLALGYENEWNASDQIPARLVERGAHSGEPFGRFSQVDPTLGGSTSRMSLSGRWTRAGTGSSQRLDLYAVRYDLLLHSNFTYFLDDPLGGDQILQHDKGRTVLGTDFVHVQPLGSQRVHELTVGLQSRLDLADVVLGEAEERRLATTVRQDEIAQWGTGAYGELESEWSPGFRTVLGLRGDVYRFDVTSDLPANSGRRSDATMSPKISLIYGPWEATEVYLSGGLGFHSNDARGTVQHIDPGSGEQVEPVDPLVQARGAELGLRATPRPGWRTTLAAWTVSMDSELLFVGDAGTTEASGASRRYGLTWTNFYRIDARLAGDVDVSLARARLTELPPAENRIPQALESVVTAGLTWEPESDGVYAALRLRHFGEYPLVEDNSVRADGTSLVNLNAGWRMGSLRLGVSILNLLNARDHDIQYFYASRLRGEPAAGVEDVHFHPVEPRQLRFAVAWGL